MTAHASQLPVSCRTMYKYIADGLMGQANIDLPRKVRYGPGVSSAGTDPSTRTAELLELPGPFRRRAPRYPAAPADAPNQADEVKSKLSLW